MDLRKGSDVPTGKRRCIRCRGRRKLYKIRGAWSFENCGSGALQDCPMCGGKGHVDPPPSEIAAGFAIANIKEKACGEKRRRKVKDKEY
jgi:hypothetical protein